jgi:hypothetical protein
MEIFMNDKLIHLKSLPFWGKLTPVEQEAVIRGTYFNTYRAGTMIDNSDEECMGMLKVVSGCIRVRSCQTRAGRSPFPGSTRGTSVC